MQKGQRIEKKHFSQKSQTVHQRIEGGLLMPKTNRSDLFFWCALALAFLLGFSAGFTFDGARCVIPGYLGVGCILFFLHRFTCEGKSWLTESSAPLLFLPGGIFLFAQTSVQAHNLHIAGLASWFCMDPLQPRYGNLVSGPFRYIFLVPLFLGFFLPAGIGALMRVARSKHWRVWIRPRVSHLLCAFLPFVLGFLDWLAGSFLFNLLLPASSPASRILLFSMDALTVALGVFLFFVLFATGKSFLSRRSAWIGSILCPLLLLFRCISGIFLHGDPSAFPEKLLVPLLSRTSPYDMNSIAVFAALTAVSLRALLSNRTKGPQYLLKEKPL